MEIEVRCCCKPGLLLGWIDIKDSYLLRKRFIEFPVSNYPDTTARFFNRGETSLKYVNFKTVTLEYAKFYEGGEFIKMAFKDNNYPISDLRKIPNFRENTINC